MGPRIREDKGTKMGPRIREDKEGAARFFDSAPLRSEKHLGDWDGWFENRRYPIAHGWG